MSRPPRSFWPLVCSHLALIFSVCAFSFTAQASDGGTQRQLFTNIHELRLAVEQTPGQICQYNLEGTVLGNDQRTGIIFFLDASGTDALQVRQQSVALVAGDRIRLRGTNFIAITPNGLSLGTEPVVDADNQHSTVERFGSIHLAAGKRPIQLDWFNWTGTESLSLEYSGPGISRRPVPNDVLFLPGSLVDGGQGKPGVAYRDFEGTWNSLPDFDQLTPVKFGTTTNFNIQVQSRAEYVGLEFSAYLDIPTAGDYTFYLRSDDGSRLFFYASPPEITILGHSTIPAAETIAIGQVIPENQEALWAEVTGRITFLGCEGDQTILELTSGDNHLRVQLLDAPPEIPAHLQGARVLIRGLCPVRRNSEGQKVVETMLAMNWRDVRVLNMAPENESVFPQATVAELIKPTAASTVSRIVHLRGHLSPGHGDGTWQLNDGTGIAEIELLEQPRGTNEVECLGRWSLEKSRVVIHEAVCRDIANQTDATAQPHQLTTAMQVQQLSREQAARQIPVQIQGVITWRSEDFKCLLIQDATRAVYVWIGNSSSQSLPRVGDYCELKGITEPADFSPIVLLRSVKTLWHGSMPTPVIPTRGQLMSGSLDAQYVEIRGLLVTVHDNYISLLTEEGPVDLDVNPLPAAGWQNFLNSIIRIRGCLLANWDPQTHRVILNQPLHLRSALVTIDSPPPLDPFQADPVSVPELMQFDAHFSTFRRVKVTGQVIHHDHDLFYLMQDGYGLRFRLNQDQSFAIGDIVEVVGLVEIDGVSPLLRQAVARKVGHSPLPSAHEISVNALSDRDDSTLVWVKGTLVDTKVDGDDKVLELQAGAKTFTARLNKNLANNMDWPPMGSQLKLTGVFSALDGASLPGRNVNSFELLLNSPADVEVLAYPPWWTLPRLLAMMAILMCGLALAFIWIHSLRRQVERRTNELQREIVERERAEKSRAIEQERSRIARDLHDELGSELTEINMLAATSPNLKIEPQSAFGRLQEILEKSRSMISSLDGVVWIINSRNDKLSALIEYLASYAEEFLGKAAIGCRVELPGTYTDLMIQAETRHDILLAVRESLNNAVRHGQPTEVLLQISLADGRLQIAVKDNGCGFDPHQTKGNGLGNLRQRMKKLNGSCEINSAPGRGTSVELNLPLPSSAASF